MPFADPRARLEHILEAIREIEGFASGRTLQDYLSQGWLRFATQRGIEIVSEASRGIGKSLEDPAGGPGDPAPRITDIARCPCYISGIVVLDGET